MVDLTAAPKDADVFDQRRDPRVNPALGVFLDAETAVQGGRAGAADAQRRKARSAICAATSGFGVGRTCCARRRCGTWATMPIDEGIFSDGRPVYAGLDLSARLDLTALVLAAEDDSAAHSFEAAGLDAGERP